jgi:hypothetical protein
MSALSEQQAFYRRQKEQLRARVRHAADINRDLTWEALADRFRLDTKTIVRWCPDFPREPDWFGNDRRGRTA